MQFSIVIPARNEEKHLQKCLDSIYDSINLTKLDYEIVVVINRCSDKTEEIAKSNHCIIVHSDKKNLSAIRNAGADAASGKILVTIDADSRVSKNMFSNIYKVISTKRYIGGGVMIFPERLSLGIFLTGLSLVPITIWHRILGGLFFVLLKDFREIGGFNEEYFSAEDIEFAKRLKSHGKNKNKKFSLLFSSYIITSCRKFDHFGDWYFLINYKEMLSLFKGNNIKSADKIWYEIER
jgi:glycosyltransferase involved in cell wall biosynthesis